MLINLMNLIWKFWTELMELKYHKLMKLFYSITCGEDYTLIVGLPRSKYVLCSAPEYAFNIFNV